MPRGVYEVMTTVAVEAASEEDAEESVWRFWLRACEAVAHTTDRGVLTALRIGEVAATDDEPVYTRGERAALLALDALG